MPDRIPLLSAGHTMTISTVAIVSVFIALVLGIALGWFAHGSLRPHGAINATRSLDRPKFAGDSGLLNEESVNQHPPASRPEPGLTPALESLAVVERSLESINGQLRTMESERSHTAASLTSQIQALSRTSTRLNERTDQLVNALRSPNVRGRWGEMQLERVVELGEWLNTVISVYKQAPSWEKDSFAPIWLFI